jgi:hypothetical protein
MSSSGIRVIRAFLITIAVFLILVFTSFIIVSKVILPDKIRTYVEAYFKSKGYKIKIEDVEFNVPSGVLVNGVSVFALHNLESPIISIARVQIKPDSLDSLINRRIKLEKITIDSPSFLTDKGELEKLVSSILKKREITKRDEEKLSLIRVEHLEIKDAEIRLASGVSVNSKKFFVDFIDAELKGDRALNLRGQINLQKNEIEVEGRIKPFLDPPIGEIKLKAHELNTEKFSKILQSSERVQAVSSLSFQISDKISAQGVVDFMPARDNGKEVCPSLGKIEYDLSFDKVTETVFVNSLSLNVFDLIRLSLNGTVEKSLGEAVFNLEGKGEQIQLEKLEEMLKRFPKIPIFKSSGGIDPSDIRITGSIRNRDAALSGKVVLNEVNIDDNNHGLKLDWLHGVFHLKKFLYDNSSEGFYASGNFSLRKASSKSLDINSVSGRVEVASLGKEITLKSDSLLWKNFSIGEVKSGSGRLKRLVFSLGENNHWALDISSDVSELLIFGEGVRFKQYHVAINRDGEGITGNVMGKDVSYKNIAFPNIYADLNMSGSLLKLTNIRMKIKNYGELKAKNLSINLNQEDGAPYKIELEQGSFTGFDKKIESKGIGGKFLFYIDNKKTRFSGNLKINESDVYKSRLTNLSFNMKSSTGAMSLENISARVLGGNLKGNASIKRVKSINSISSEVEFQDGFIPLRDSILTLGRVSIDYKGELGKGPLPKGSGMVILGNLGIRKDDKASSFSGRIELKTIGETFIIENGFIEDKGRGRVPFSARMEDSLNGNRRLNLNLPDIRLELVKKVLAPILPDVISSGEFKGDAGLSLTSNRFLQEEASFDGTVSIKDVSFTGKYNSHNFYINGINGTISLKDKVKSENALASLMGERLKLDKKVFRGFIDAVTPGYLNKEGEFLSVREVEYGFLRLENIECEVELDKSRLNLKRFESTLYKGKMFGTGLLDYKGEDKYNISVVFKDISLKSLTDSIPSIKDYISGRINGIIWITGEGAKLNTLNGPFRFWDVDSKGEDRRIGQAFLKYLGARERLFFGTSHKYDNAELDGYVRDGVITFKELDISHTVFGIKTLSVRVDKRRNSIAAAHFLSVIREMAKRAGAGKVKIQFGN